MAEAVCSVGRCNTPIRAASQLGRVDKRYVPREGFPADSSSSEADCCASDDSPREVKNGLRSSKSSKRLQGGGPGYINVTERLETLIVTAYCRRWSVARRAARPGSGLPGTRFELWTGQSWCDSDNVQARAYAVEVQPGEKLATGPFEAQTVPVSVEQNYVVITV